MFELKASAVLDGIGLFRTLFPQSKGLLFTILQSFDTLYFSAGSLSSAHRCESISSLYGGDH